MSQPVRYKGAASWIRPGSRPKRASSPLAALTIANSTISLDTADPSLREFAAAWLDMDPTLPWLTLDATTLESAVHNDTALELHHPLAVLRFTPASLDLDRVLKDISAFVLPSKAHLPQRLPRLAASM